MKKIILTVVVMMTLTVSYAKNEAFRPADNAERFDMTIDMRRLAVKLELNEYQMEALQIVHDNFNSEMQSAATARGHYRRMLVHQAVRKDAEQMQRILNDKQFNTYMMLLGTTLHNRGL